MTLYIHLHIRHTNSGKWKFIGVPSLKKWIYRLLFHCYWVGDTPKLYDCYVLMEVGSFLPLAGSISTMWDLHGTRHVASSTSTNQPSWMLQAGNCYIVWRLTGKSIWKLRLGFLAGANCKFQECMFGWGYLTKPTEFRHSNKKLW